MSGVWVDGSDGVGWSIDADRDHLKQLLTAAGIRIATHWYNAEVIHNVWWNLLDSWKRRLLWRNKTLIATTTNYVQPDNLLLKRLAQRVHTWVVPSCRQEEQLHSCGLRTLRLPFYVEEEIFGSPRMLAQEREVICESLRIDARMFADRTVIGSFQRDSEANLLIPKWQKGPDRFVALLRALAKQRPVMALLAGPRRHWIRGALTDAGIPFVFVGQPLCGDDLAVNTLAKPVLARLYRLCDAYVVSSNSEGGPKAILECCWSGVPCLSTDVGLARDFLPASSLYVDAEDGAKRLHALMSDPTSTAKVKSYQRMQIEAEASFSVLARRLRTFYATLDAEKTRGWWV